MLKGDRVLLRALRRDDLPRLCAFQNDPPFEILTGGDPWEPQSLERLQAWFDSQAAHGERDGPRFAVEADGMLIGTCGLFGFDHAAQVCEVGIGIGDPAYQGRGYGRDALRTLMGYAFRIRNQRKLWLRVNGTNERAIRAYRACGFVEEGRLRAQVWSDGAYADLVLMGIQREEWQHRGTE